MSEENNEDFNNLENYELQNNSIRCNKTKIVLLAIILPLSFILITGIIFYYFILRKNKCKLGFKLVDGKCEENYSFKAEYFVNQDNKLINLIYYTYLDNIIELIIDNKRIYEPCTNYTFNSKGFHTAYFLLNISNLTSVESMFKYNSEMTSIQFSSLFNTENITDMSYMFSSTRLLASIDVSNFNTENVKYMTYMFYGMNLLRSIDVSNFKIQNLIDISSMFSYCINLTSINLPTLNATNLVRNKEMFYECNKLKSVDLSNFNAPNLKDMKSMFAYCNSLEYVNFTGFNAPYIEDMFYVFGRCHSLKSVDLSSLKSNGTILSLYAIFYDCTSLTYINLCNIKTKDSDALSYMIDFCPNLTYIDISSFEGRFNSSGRNELPPNGTIVIKSEFLKLIRKEIPKDWVIKYAD